MPKASELINRSNTICHYKRFSGFSEPNCNGCHDGYSKMVELLHLFAENRLVQWDTSPHDWLEGRGEEMLLINMIDDATSRWFARFVSSDSTVENMNHLQRYLKKHGRPLAYYTDKAAIFQTAEKTKRDGSRLGKSREELPPT